MDIVLDSKSLYLEYSPGNISTLNRIYINNEEGKLGYKNILKIKVDQQVPSSATLGDIIITGDNNPDPIGLILDKSNRRVDTEGGDTYIYYDLTVDRFNLNDQKPEYDPSENDLNSDNYDSSQTQVKLVKDGSKEGDLTLTCEIWSGNTLLGRQPVNLKVHQYANLGLSTPDISSTGQSVASPPSWNISSALDDYDEFMNSVRDFNDKLRTTMQGVDAALINTINTIENITNTIKKLRAMILGLSLEVLEQLKEKVIEILLCKLMNITDWLDSITRGLSSLLIQLNNDKIRLEMVNATIDIEDNKVHKNSVKLEILIKRREQLESKVNYDIQAIVSVVNGVLPMPTTGAQILVEYTDSKGRTQYKLNPKVFKDLFNDILKLVKSQCKKFMQLIEFHWNNMWNQTAELMKGFPDLFIQITTVVLEPMAAVTMPPVTANPLYAFDGVKRLSAQAKSMTKCLDSIFDSATFLQMPSIFLDPFKSISLPLYTLASLS